MNSLLVAVLSCTLPRAHRAAEGSEKPGHATYIDGKMLSVTKYIEFKFGLYKHMNRRRAPLVRSLFVLTIEMADIPSVASLMRT